MRRAPLLLWLVGAAIVAAVVAGLMVVGGPEEARGARLDRDRVNDLQRVAVMIHRYWQTEGALPKTLDELPWSEEESAAHRVDPETGIKYGYRIVDEVRFRLCAVFSTRGPHSLPHDDFRIGRAIQVLGPAIDGPGEGCLFLWLRER